MEYGKPSDAISIPSVRPESSGHVNYGQKADDNLSIKSSDSINTSGEFEIVSEAPMFSVALDGTTSSPILDIINVSCDLQTDSLEPIREPKQLEDLNLSDCLYEDEVVVSLVPAAPQKLEPISPILNIEGNGNFMDLQKNMDEVIHELDEERTLSASDGDPGSANKSKLLDCIAMCVAWHGCLFIFVLSLCMFMKFEILMSKLSEIMSSLFPTEEYVHFVNNERDRKTSQSFSIFSNPYLSYQ